MTDPGRVRHEHDRSPWCVAPRGQADTRILSAPKGSVCVKQHRAAAGRPGGRSREGAYLSEPSTWRWSGGRIESG